MKHNTMIARSGVQYYLDEEIPKLMKGGIPREFKGQRVFGVYRPAFVLEGAKSKFVMAPVRVEHKWIYHDGDPEIIGRICDDVSIERLGEEVALKASVDVDDSMLPEFRELSPGYLSDNRWVPGVAPDGTPYEILCTGISEVNHLAVVKEARGGSEMKILDGGKKLMVHSGLIHSIKRRIMGVFDGKFEDTFENCVDKISETLNNGGKGLDALVQSLTEKCGTLPDSGEKEKLVRYIADIPLLTQEDEAVRKEALSCIKESYKALDSDALSETTEKPMEEKKEEKVEEKKVEEKTTDAAPCDGAPAEPVANPNEPGQPQSAEAQGEAEHASVIEAIEKMSASIDAKLDKLINALCDKAGAADENGAACDGEKVEEKKEEEKVEEKQEGVTDALPQYTQSLGAVQKGYTLDDMFAKLKGRK